MEKIIFLDIDGVLNDCSIATSKLVFEPGCVAQVQRVIDETGAKIVVSSDWRLYHDMEEMQHILEDVAGLKCDVIGYTPCADAGASIYVSGLIQRRKEIMTWLKTNNFTGSYVVIDDRRDACVNRSTFVRTNWKLGMMSDNADHAIDILNREE